MTWYRLGGVLLAVATLLVCFLPAGTASADHRPVSILALTVQAPEGASSTVLLRCRPAGGSHPSPYRACWDLALADGDFDRLPGSPQTLSCTLEYRPVVASARGWWDGRTVYWKHRYGNDCALHAETGVVFDF